MRRDWHGDRHARQLFLHHDMASPLPDLSEIVARQDGTNLLPGKNA